MRLGFLVVCIAASIATACGKVPTVEPEPTPPGAAPERATTSEATPEPSPRHVVTTTYFRSKTADLLRLWSDGSLEVGTREPEHWEPMQAIDDGIGVASNRRQACVLHKRGNATCWSGKDWRTRSWSPEFIVGGRQIVARKSDICVLLRDAVTCMESPIDKDSRHASLQQRRYRYLVREAKRRGTSPPARPPVQEPPLPTYTTRALPDVVRMVANGWGPHGLITRDGKFLLGLDDLTEIDKLPPVSDVVMLDRWDFCAIDREGRVWCAAERHISPEPRLVDGISNAAQLEAFVDPEAGTSAFTACARSDDGTIACWGSNRLGTIGSGPWGGYVKSEDALRVDVPAATTLSMVEGWVCVDTASEGRWCWGDGRASPSWSSPVGVTIIDASPVDEIAAGPSSLCVRRQSEVQCSTLPPVAGLVTVHGLPPAVSFVDNEYDLCVRALSGERVCWSEEGGRTKPALPRTPASPDRWDGLPWDPTDVAALVVGTGSEGMGEHACARSKTGEVRCRLGGFGSGSTPFAGPASDDWPSVELPEPAEQVVVIGNGACARLESGRVACWGGAAALATGHPTAVPRPVQIGSPWPALPPPTGFGAGS